MLAPGHTPLPVIFTQGKRPVRYVAGLSRAPLRAVRLPALEAMLDAGAKCLKAWRLLAGENRLRPETISVCGAERSGRRHDGRHHHLDGIPDRERVQAAVRLSHAEVAPV